MVFAIVFKLGWPPKKLEGDTSETHIYSPSKWFLHRPVVFVSHIQLNDLKLPLPPPVPSFLSPIRRIQPVAWIQSPLDSSPNPSTSCHPLPDPKTPLHSRSSFRRQRKPEPQRLPPSTGRDEAPTVRPPLRGESQLVTVVLAEDFGHLCGVLVAGAPLPRAEPLLPPEAPGTWGTRHAPPGPVTGATGRFKRQDQVTHGDAWPMVKRTVRWTCSGFEVQGLFEEWKRNVLDSVSTGPLVNWAPKGLARSLFQCGGHPVDLYSAWNHHGSGKPWKPPVWYSENGHP